MTYELAKQLKEKGFAQKTNPTRYFLNEELKWVKIKEEDFSNAELVMIPSLSELIEACGDGFKTLNRLAENQFRATGIKDSVIICDNSTPEEAVAKLWLALQNNK